MPLTRPQLLALPLALAIALTPLVATASAAAQTSAPGGELNPMGGILAGNAAGTIPAWTGGLPKSALDGDRVSDPFAADQALYTVTAYDLEQYAHLLSEGQKAMLTRHPESWVMPVYQSRRSASYPSMVYDALLENRQTATLVVEGENSGVRNAAIASPFPEPDNGLEAIWNHTMRWRGIRLERETSWIAVTTQGYYRPIILFEQVAFPYASPWFDLDKEAPNFPQAQIAFKQKFLSPGRLSGRGSLTYEGYDYTRHDRVRWSYSKELKRVLRLPRQRLDQPVSAADGIVNFDDTDMFHGSPALFDWELAGRQELLIPYNAYRLKDRSLGFSDLIKKHHLNQKYTRYELHRVWKLIATAKDPKKSTFSKRIFYLDEDSWQIVLSEKYDWEGTLVQFAEAHTVNYYQVPVLFTAAIAHYRLNDGRFLVTDLNNSLLPYHWSDEINPRQFSPNALQDYIR
jgi:hypothetical protein